VAASVEAVSVESGLVTVSSGAKWLSLSASKVWGLIRAKRLPVVRIDGATRLDLADLRRFVEMAKTSSAT